MKRHKLIRPLYFPKGMLSPAAQDATLAILEERHPGAQVLFVDCNPPKRHRNWGGLFRDPELTSITSKVSPHVMVWKVGSDLSDDEVTEFVESAKELYRDAKHFVLSEGFFTYRKSLGPWGYVGFELLRMGWLKAPQCRTVDDSPTTFLPQRAKPRKRVKLLSRPRLKVIDWDPGLDAPDRAGHRVRSNAGGQVPATV